MEIGRERAAQMRTVEKKPQHENDQTRYAQEFSRSRDEVVDFLREE